MSQAANLLTLITALFLGSNPIFAAGELCDRMPLGQNQSNTTYLCVEELSSTRGIVKFKSNNAEKICDAKIRGTSWTASCKITSEVQIDGMTLINETLPLKFSVMSWNNPETDRPAATVDFQSPEQGIMGIKRWYLHPSR